MVRRSMIARRRIVVAALLLAGAVLLAGCNYVVLGDSIGRRGPATYATEYGKTLHATPVVDAVDGEQLPGFEDGLLHNAQWQHDIAHADVITLSIGSNDLDIDLLAYEFGGCNAACSDPKLQEFETQYARMLDELRGMTKARITVLDIYDPLPRLIDAYARGKLAEINAFIHRSACAHPNMVAAAVNLAFNGPDGTADPVSKGYLAPDGTHPSPLGAQVIAKAVAAARC